jgi:hypothetical protein
LRYGIEYLLFELLVLASESLTLDEYRQAVGKPKQMRRMLSSPARNYTKLAEFNRVITSVDLHAPPLRFWNLDELFRYWGVASEFLHFVGAHSLTYSEPDWAPKAIARLDSVLDPIWSAVTETLGTGLMKPH